MSRSGTYVKPNGWLPLHKRLIAVELKLARVDDAFLQAINNQGFADESYVALPAERAKLLMSGRRKFTFRERGIGVISVSAGDCRVVLKSARKSPSSDHASQIYSVDRFWKLHLKRTEA